MIISEKQIMELMAHTSVLIHRMVLEHAPIEHIQGVSKVLEDITKQQSEELRVVE